MNAETKIIIAWLLFIPLVVNNVRTGFATYRADAKAWKLLVHLVTIIVLGVLIADAGVFIMRMKYTTDMSIAFAFNYPRPKVVAHKAPAARAAADRKIHVR
ncbi:MAG: hypothetical protein HY926_08515 [Elusimicrobia bacterium]|nr:hypothetical protein [Elusimicrobiota bacterium]